jgi:uncharacterized protein YkwD
MKKKVISLLLISTIALTLMTGASAAGERYTVTDALTALKAAMGEIILPDYQIERYDVNRDGRITVTDALMILRLSMGMSNFTLPNRRLTDNERAQWIVEYRAFGGASEFELEIVRLINEIRLEHNLSYLVIDDTLMMAARFHTQVMCYLGTPDNWSHNAGPYGVEGARHGASANVAAAFGGQLRWNGGNAFSGGTTPEDIVNGWMNSEGHRNYILSPEHICIGAGRYDRYNYMFLSNTLSP